MMTLIIVIHVIACIVLITLVLIQRGRGSGLVESFAGVESMFGTKTSAFLTRTTTIMSVVFFITCLTLAVLSVRQSKSLMGNLRSRPMSRQAAKTEAAKPGTLKMEPVKTEPAKAESVKVEPVKAEVVKTEVPKTEAAKAVATVDKAKPGAGKAE